MSQSTSGCLRRRVAEPAFQLLKPFVSDRHCKSGVGIKFGAAAENLRLRRHADFIIFPRFDDLILVLVKPPRKAAACLAREMQDLIFKLLDAHGDETRLRCSAGKRKGSHFQSSSASGERITCQSIPRLAGEFLLVFTCNACSIRSTMSMTQIIEELPRLTLAERRALCTRIQELEPEQETLDLCDTLALDAVQMLDRMEEEDARRAQR
jgi:hypothetical protein